MRPILCLLALAGCKGFGNLPSQGNEYLGEALWDPSHAWPVIDGLYVDLPYAGSVALLPNGAGEAAFVSLESGTVTSVHASPDAETLALLVADRICVDEGAEKGSCEEYDDLQRLDIVRGAKVAMSVDVGPGWNSVHFTADGSRAVLRIDQNELGEINAVLDLTSVLVVDLETGEGQPVPVGFAPENLLFTTLPDGSADRAVVLSENEVAVVDLLASPPTTVVTFPLVIDPDDTVVPLDVALTPNGEHAILSVQGLSDLYVLDLEAHSTNLVELSAVPTSFQIFQTLDLEEADYVVVVSRQEAFVDLIDDVLFDTRSVALDEPMGKVWTGDTFALLWESQTGRDVVRIDPVTGDTVEYRLQNPANRLFVAPGEEYAIALTTPGYDGGLFGSNPGLEVLDLRSDGVQPYLLEGAGLGVSWAVGDNTLHALVLQDGVDYVYQLDLYSGSSEELNVSEGPRMIGSMNDGRFFVTHSAPLGLVSLIDPASGDVTELSGFAALNLLDPSVLGGGDTGSTDDEYSTDYTY